MYRIEDIYDDIKNGATLSRIYNKYGGFSIYITQRMPNYKEKILEEFNGYNYKDLAQRYNVAEYSVRRIINQKI